ncbi:hypothetical protein HK096_004485 [Nowakowskiella sp. JEL0078]|nr:hypothetical protein HK096_004485 [Nowakowskiella sp. JEL0078]
MCNSSLSTNSSFPMKWLQSLFGKSQNTFQIGGIEFYDHDSNQNVESANNSPLRSRLSPEEANCVVGVPPDTVKYDAISHVWGSTKRFEIPIGDNSYLEAPLSSSRKCNLLSKLLQINMHKVWFDPISVPAADSPDYLMTMLTMDTIYHQAERVIVVVPEATRIAVCRYIITVASFCRCTDSEISEMYSTMTPFLDDLWDDVANQPYFTRAWTTQEMLLARKVVFLDEEASLLKFHSLPASALQTVREYAINHYTEMKSLGKTYAHEVLQWHAMNTVFSFSPCESFGSTPPLAYINRKLSIQFPFTMNELQAVITYQERRCTVPIDYIFAYYRIANLEIDSSCITTSQITASYLASAVNASNSDNRILSRFLQALGHVLKDSESCALLVASANAIMAESALWTTLTSPIHGNDPWTLAFERRQTRLRMESRRGIIVKVDESYSNHGEIKLIPIQNIEKLEFFIIVINQDDSTFLFSWKEQVVYDVTCHFLFLLSDYSRKIGEKSILLAEDAPSIKAVPTNVDVFNNLVLPYITIQPKVSLLRKSVDSWKSWLFFEVALCKHVSGNWYSIGDMINSDAKFVHTLAKFEQLPNLSLIVYSPDFHMLFAVLELPRNKDIDEKYSKFPIYHPVEAIYCEDHRLNVGDHGYFAGLG